MAKLPYRTRNDRIRLKSKMDSNSPTKQEFKESCDVNNIMRNYEKTGIITHINSSEPRYGFVEAQTYQDALNAVISAQQRFNELPSAVRDAFDNDPETFLKALDDPEHQEKLKDLGLIVSPSEQSSAPAEVAQSGEKQTQEQQPESA